MGSKKEQSGFYLGEKETRSLEKEDGYKEIFIYTHEDEGRKRRYYIRVTIETKKGLEDLSHQVELPLSSKGESIKGEGYISKGTQKSQKTFDNNYFVTELTDKENDERSLRSLFCFAESSELELTPYNLSSYLETLSIEDATLEKTFGSETNIQEQDIINYGINRGFGKRRYKITFDSELETFLGSQEEEKAYSQKVSLYWKNEGQASSVEPDSDNENLYCFIDTDSNTLTRGKPSILNLELQISPKANCKICYGIETEIDIIKPVIDPPTVFIDFGTSSTCVAIQKEGEIEYDLLRISDDDLGDDAEEKYENSSELFLYNWEELKQGLGKWNPQNYNADIFASCFVADLVDNDEQKAFSYGSFLKEIRKEILQGEEHGDAKRTAFLSSLISEIKGVHPRNLENISTSVHSFVKNKKGERSEVTLGDQEDYDFDPVSFYAMILGYKINKIDSDHIYAKFKMTMPVGFTEKKQEAILNAFQKGLIHSLPFHLRNSIDVQGTGSEPVSLAKGIIKYNEKNKDVSKEKNTFVLNANSKKSKLFGVFDYGGGTLDFCGGILRLIQERDEKKIQSDVVFYEGMTDAVLQPLAQEGFNELGGERIIETISYLFILNNYEWLRDNDISIRLPDHDGYNQYTKYDDDFQKDIKQEVLEEGTTTRKILSQSKGMGEQNFKLLNELFSRPFWLEGCNSTGDLYELQLLDNDKKTLDFSAGTNESKDLKVTDPLKGLSKGISKWIKDKATDPFFNFLKKMHEDNKTPLKDGKVSEETFLHLFLSGNVCKSPIVYKQFQKSLKEYQQKTSNNGHNFLAKYEIVNLAKDPLEKYTANCKTLVVMGAAANLSTLHEIPLTQNSLLFKVDIWIDEQHIIQKSKVKMTWYPLKRPLTPEMIEFFLIPNFTFSTAGETEKKKLKGEEKDPIKTFLGLTKEEYQKGKVLVFFFKPVKDETGSTVKIACVISDKENWKNFKSLEKQISAELTISLQLSL